MAGRAGWPDALARDRQWFEEWTGKLKLDSVRNLNMMDRERFETNTMPRNLFFSIKKHIIRAFSGLFYHVVVVLFVTGIAIIWPILSVYISCGRNTS